MKNVKVALSLVSSFILIATFKGYQFYPSMNWRFYFAAIGGLIFLFMLTAILKHAKSI